MCVWLLCYCDLLVVNDFQHHVLLVSNVEHVLIGGLERLLGLIRSALRMPELALGTVRALLAVRTTFHVLLVGNGLETQKVVERGSVLAERIVGRHEYVVDERVHEHALLDDQAELVGLVDVVLEVVVGHDDALLLHGPLEHVEVVVAHDALGAESLRRREVYLVLLLHVEQSALVGRELLARRGRRRVIGVERLSARVCLVTTTAAAWRIGGRR